MTNESRRIWGNTAAAIAIAIALLGATACTDAEVVRLEPSDTVISFEPSTTTYPFEQAQLDVAQLILVPATQEGQDASGGAQTRIIADTVTIDLLTGRALDGPLLRAGSYEVIELALARIPRLRNDDPAPIDDPVAECWEKIGLFQEGVPGSTGQGLLRLPLDTAAQPLVLTVAPGPSDIGILIDTDVLLEAYVDAFVCNDFPGGTCRNNPPPLATTAPCLVTFNLNAFLQDAVAAFGVR